MIVEKMRPASFIFSIVSFNEIKNLADAKSPFEGNGFPRTFGWGKRPTGLSYKNS